MEELKSKYYFINEETGFFLGEKTTVHILLVFIGIIILVGILMFRKNLSKG